MTGNKDQDLDRSTDNLIAPEIEDILKHPMEKSYRDLRDRAAYMHITGGFPSHLRGDANRWLRLISESGRARTALGRQGPLRILQQVADQLDLANHPMVTKVREKVGEGYRITISRSSSNRMPYGKIFLYKGSEEVTVQIDGSVLDHW